MTTAVRSGKVGAWGNHCTLPWVQDSSGLRVCFAPIIGTFMRSLKATLLFCIVGLFAGVLGLEALGQTELPSAPSSAQPQDPSQKTPKPQVGSARQGSTQPTPAKPDAAPSSGSTENQQTG